MNSGIEVFFTQINKPWTNAQPQSSQHLYVNVYGPDGPVHVGIPAPQGYASIDLPPGRYLVTGTINYVYVNFDSNETLINVGCGQRPCVTIIPRSLHFCIWWLRAAMLLIKENPKLAPEIAGHAPKAIELLTAIEGDIPTEHHQLGFLTESIKTLSKKSRK